MGVPPPDVQPLSDPSWLTEIVLRDPLRLDLHAKAIVDHMAMVESQRVARLAELSAGTAAERARTAAQAIDKVGSGLWHIAAVRSYQGTRGEEEYGIGNNKCNLFVYEMLTQAGARVEQELRERRVIGTQVSYPPLAGQWADPSHAIPGFEVLNVPPDVPQPGDVAAVKHDSWDASGHVGIVVGPNETVSATPQKGVIRSEWGFRPEQKGEVVYRRYVGWDEPRGSSPDTGMRTSGVAHDTVPPAPEKPRDRNRCAARK